MLKLWREVLSDFTVSTIKANDRVSKQFETAICTNYSQEIKVVRIYDTLEEALDGHLLAIEEARKMTKQDFEELEDALENYDMSLTRFMSLYFLGDSKEERKAIEEKARILFEQKTR